MFATASVTGLFRGLMEEVCLSLLIIVICCDAMQGGRLSGAITQLFKMLVDGHGIFCANGETGSMGYMDGPRNVLPGSPT